MAPAPAALVARLNTLSIEVRFHDLLSDLCGGEADYLADISTGDLEGRSDATGNTIAAPVARGIVRKLQSEVGRNQTEAKRAPVAAPIVLRADDIRELRKMVAAKSLPDEGMRGSDADQAKLQAASDPAVLAALGAALRGRSMDAAVAAGIVRSVAITPQAAFAVCGAVAAGLCGLLRRTGPMVAGAHAWCLPAVARLAQHKECHGALLQAGAAKALQNHARYARNSSQQDSVPRLDLVACLALALLSETAGPDVARCVPLRAVSELVDLLHRRLFVTDPEDVVEQKLFCGLPLDYRPRFVAQALTRLAERSGAHAAMAWQTTLPELLLALLQDDLPNDSAVNRPFGSPDIVEIAPACVKALLGTPGGQPEARRALQETVSNTSKL